MRKKKEYNNNIIKQIERLNKLCMTSLRNDDGWHSQPKREFSSIKQGEQRKTTHKKKSHQVRKPFYDFSLL